MALFYFSELRDYFQIIFTLAQNGDQDAQLDCYALSEL